MGDDPRTAPRWRRWCAARLLVAREAEDGTAYEMAHEALLAGWEHAARWLAEDAERREVQARLEAAAAEWERLGRARDALWGARQLAEAAVLDAGELTRREQAFLEASRGTVVRSRRLRRALALGFVAARWGSSTAALKLREHWRLDAEVRGAAGRGRASLAQRAQASATRSSAERADGLPPLRLAGRKAEGDAAVAARRAAHGRVLRERFDAWPGRLERALVLDARRGRTCAARWPTSSTSAPLLAEREGEPAARPSCCSGCGSTTRAGSAGGAGAQPARLTLELDAPGARRGAAPG